MLRESASSPPGLLEVDRERHKYSLLNVDTLDRIAKNILPDDIQSCTSDCPIADPHPAANRDANHTPHVLVGLAMGNLNGFPLSLRLNQGVGVSSSVEFSYSQYKDRFVMRMSRPNSDPTADLILEEWEEYDTTSSAPGRWGPRQGPHREVSWSELREIALSSGAFPFAFAVRQITRHSDQDSSHSAVYASRDSDRKRKAFVNDPDPFDGRYIYTDGGVFENEPIGLAISLIESLYGQDAIMDEDRYFLFIAPGARQASSDPFRSIKEKEADHISVAKALVSAIMGQSRFQDWIKQNRPPKVLAITSEDGKLLGDVFSAFAGFLEEKFRAYDYNIGRQTAQEKLGLLFQTGNSPIKPIPIEGPLWPPTRRLERAWVAGLDHTPSSWPEAMEHFGKLASISKTEKGQRDQIAELKALLANVEPTSRELIREQILDRVRSLVGFLYISVPRRKSNQGLRGAMLNVAFWLMGLWALIRGRKTMENFAARLADNWLRNKLEL